MKRNESRVRQQALHIRAPVYEGPRLPVVLAGQLRLDSSLANVCSAAQRRRVHSVDANAGELGVSRLVEVQCKLLVAMRRVNTKALQACGNSRRTAVPTHRMVHRASRNGARKRLHKLRLYEDLRNHAPREPAAACVWPSAASRVVLTAHARPTATRTAPRERAEGGGKQPQKSGLLLISKPTIFAKKRTYAQKKISE